MHLGSHIHTNRHCLVARECQRACVNTRPLQEGRQRHGVTTSGTDGANAVSEVFRRCPYIIGAGALGQRVSSLGVLAVEECL